MADKKISALTPGDPAQATDMIPIARAGANYEVSAGSIATALSPVSSVAGKTGAVTLVEGDVANLVSDLALKAPLASPALTGTPTAPTPTTGDDSTKIATTAFVEDTIDSLAAGDIPNITESQVTNLVSDLALKAPLDSPAFTTIATIKKDGIGNQGTGNTPVSALILKNLTAAIAGAGNMQDPPTIEQLGQYWDGAATQPGSFKIEGHFGTNASMNLLYLLTGLASAGYNVLFKATAPATSGQNVVPPSFNFVGSIWNGSAAAQETWQFQISLGIGANPTSTFTLQHFGTSGLATFDLTQTGIRTLVPTQAALDNSTKAASTGYADAAVSVETTRATTAEALKAPLASPALTGSPTAPTPAALDNATDLATTAYVDRYVYGVGITGFREDWIQTPSATNVTTTTTASGFGDGGWDAAQIVGGTQVLSSQDGSYSNPGQIVMTTSAATGQGLALFRGGPSGRGSFGALGSNAGWEINIIAKLNQTTNCCIRLGVAKGVTQVSDPPTDWFGVEYDTANAGNSDTKFTWVTRSGSSSNYNTTNAISPDTSFHHFRIRSTQAGHILFSVDGGTETDVSTNVSAANMNPFIQIIARTTGAVVATVDFYSVIAKLSRT